MKMSSIRSAGRAIPALATSAALVLLCASGMAQEPKRGGAVTYINGRMPSTLVPSIEPSAGVAMVGTKVMESLFVVDAANNVVPRLALSMVPSGNGTVFTVKLRQGVKWHDGQAFTPADVAFSMMNAWKVFVSNAAFAAVTAADVVGSDTVVFRTSRPVSPQYFARAISNPLVVVLPRHLYEGKDLRTNPVNQHPIGTGPFKVSQRDRNEYVVMERNPEYWDRRYPYLDKLTMRIMPDDGAAAAALEVDQIQLVPHSQVSLGDAQRLAKAPNTAVTTAGYEAYPWFGAVLFNLSRPALQDDRIRQAIAYAINRDQVAKSAFAGYARPATSLFRKGSEFYTEEGVPQYTFDPARSRQLLEQAGYGAGKPPLQLRLAVAPFTEGLRSTGELLQQALAAVGVQVELVQTDTPGFLRSVYRDYNFDLAVTVFTGGNDAAQSVPNYIWSKMIDKINFHNASQYRSTQADALVEQLTSEQDPAARMRAAHELQRTVLRDLPLLPLVEMSYYTAYRRSLHNVGNSPQWLFGNWADLWISQ